MSYVSYAINRRRLIARATHTLIGLGISVWGVKSIQSAHAATEKSMTLSEHATPRQVAESYWRAECDRDIERVAQHYHPDAVFMLPGERLVGWSNIRKWYEDSFRRFPGAEVEITHDISRGNEAALEWKATVTDVPGVRHSLTGVSLVRVEDGRFREVHAYFDPSPLR